MAGVSVLPPTSALGGFGSSRSSPTMQNGLQTPRSQNELISVSEIKEKAKENAHKIAKSASAISLIRTARTQTLAAQECELSGDLKGALSAFIKAGTLAQMFMDSSEFKVESGPGKKGVLYKEFQEFTQHEGSNLKQKVDGLAAKLEALDKSSAPSTTNGTEYKSGGSIGDRVRSLQDAGLTLSTTKRFSRESPNSLPTPPISPEAIRNRYSNSSLSSASASASVSSNLSPPSSSSTSSSTAASPHAFVPLSSLGPPSPTSSPSSSPQTSSSYLTEFSQHFPSIDELDEVNGWEIVPPVPTGTTSASRSSDTRSITSTTPSKELIRDTRRDAIAYRSFPVLPVDPGPRPSSTPNTPTINSFASRPASPARPSIRDRSSSPPLQPVIPTPLPRKPSGLALHSPIPPSSLASPSPTEKHRPATPVTNSMFPKALCESMYQHGYKVLVLDVRNREEFEKKHIKADAIVCIEPSVLLRETVTGSTIEDALNVGPRHEWALFTNREKFDLVAMYDNSSESFGPTNSPLSILFRAIYENEFRKILKKMPVLLVGGFDAWRRDFGDDGVVDGSAASEQPKKASGHVVVGTAPISKVPQPPPVAMPTPVSEPSRYWTPPAQDPRDRASSLPRDDAVRYSMPSRSTADTIGYVSSSDSTKHLTRKPNFTRRPSVSSRPLPEPRSSTPQPMINGTSPIQYPQFSKALSPATSGSSSYSSPGAYSHVSPPPQASINQSLSRRRSDYVDQSQEAVSGISPRPVIDYPQLSSHVLRPPPVAASSGMERHDNRPRVIHQGRPSSAAPTGPKPPTIQSDYPVTYWSDTQIGTSGLKNLGNTCYMNATIQCLSATVPFARFFTDGRWKGAVNMVNSMGTKGNLAHAFANILHDMWQGELPYIIPYQFRHSITAHASQFGGSDQHDSQEFLSFLLDGLHEDLNRILHKPTSQTTVEREAELERLPQQIASDQEWKIYRMRNDSLIVDFFQGQFRNKLECLTCHKTSTTYNSFMYLTLPVPTGRGSSKVTLTQCLDAFVKSEVMEKTDAWHCPNCQVLRRATKQLSLSRLPPVLLIHLKRFQVKGPFTDKIETLVEFPLRSLDLTNYMPPPLPPGADKSQLNGGYRMSSEDPRAQSPPYRYDLYGVTNHSGNLSNGHYTAFIASHGGWLYCDDSRVQSTDAKEVVSRRAYVLFYKRSRS